MRLTVESQCEQGRTIVQNANTVQIENARSTLLNLLRIFMNETGKKGPSESG
jgi:hypothetical protein